MQEVPRERELGQAEMRSISELERDCKMVGGLSNYHTENEKKVWNMEKKPCEIGEDVRRD